MHIAKQVINHKMKDSLRDDVQLMMQITVFFKIEAIVRKGNWTDINGLLTHLEHDLKFAIISFLTKQ